jgi:signal transduction histidine kinase
LKAKEGDMLPESVKTKTRTILIIDDEIKILLGVRVLLERNGYKVIMCEDGPCGIKMAGEFLPDLIICDIMMPLMDGFKVREKISANPLIQDIPFLFLSARASQTDKLKGFAGGADDYITKPFDPHELVARIKAVFRRQELNDKSTTLEVDFQIDRIKTEISNNISHELRTPMTQILLSLDMILRTKYDDLNELKWFVETAVSQSHRLNAVIDDLTFLNSYDMGNRQTFRQLINIKNDFDHPVSLRQDLYAEKNLQVQINIGEGVVIHAPRREFRQAISHLVDNSLKFAPPKTPVLIVLTANGNGGCILTVTNHGPGVPAELHEKVFERYYQISQGITREYGGLGVGLTIARAIARSLNGDVKILQQTGGFTIQMVLPPARLQGPW